jgi:kynurenine formamidase
LNKINHLEDLLNQLQIVELSHTLEEHIPIWPTHSKFLHTLWHSYWHGDVAIDHQLLINEHNGTHIDAPAHFIKEGESHIWINEMPLRTFWGPCAVIDLSFLGKLGVVTEEHIRQWEQKHGDIKKDDIVLLYFGWSKLWRKRPEDYEFTHDWPGVGASAAEYLVEKGVKMVGVDTLAIDVFGSTENPAHYALLGNKISIIENLNNLDQMPERGYFAALPLLIKEGSASPVRAIAFVEK